ncbi:MAG: uroporphyrinogen-III synthase [Acidobacteriota bacterium]
MNKNEQAAGDRSTSRYVPLRGKTVLVTRPRGQSEDIAARLEALGATVILCPTIEVVPPSSWVALDASIQEIKEYDWIIFTSANGVRFFFRRLGEIRSDGAQALAGLVVCAIGPATALALERAGAIAQVTASDSKAEGALMAIIDYLGGDENVRGLRFLIPRARVARDFLPAGLRRLGARVDAVETYQTVKPDVEPGSVLRIFKENSIDVVTFTSSSALSNFAALVGLTDLSVLLANMLVACIGPVTSETAASHGLKRVIQPELYNADALVASIVKSIGQE